ncbi:hypothetical protein JW898_04335 [Candidatus Woesearchaeota archaeon]|nr:hypothetical protein [Candidatus Woesearchaeota archaeon]
MKKAPIVFHYGCMASEKSLALIQDYRKAVSVGERCLCYVPANNSDPKNIVSRFMAGEGSSSLEEIAIAATPVKNSAELWHEVEAHMTRAYDRASEMGIVIARFRLNVIIDEVQLFDEGIKKVVDDLAYNGVRVVCAGLDLDFRGEPFPLRGESHVTVPDIMAISTEKHQHYAKCACPLEDGAPCGNDATRSQRFDDVEHQIPSPYEADTIIVEKGHYIPVCEEHHRVPGKHKVLLVTHNISNPS